jgi:hypothetical protein
MFMRGSENLKYAYHSQPLVFFISEFLLLHVSSKTTLSPPQYKFMGKNVICYT